jgi:YtpI-like protein
LFHDYGTIIGSITSGIFQKELLSLVNVFLWVLGALIVLTSVSSVIFSVRSRRSSDERLRGLYAARMNVSMGLMLIFIALIQMFMFSGSTVRVIVGALFMIIGLFNLFAGMRNHSHFSRSQ